MRYADRLNVSGEEEEGIQDYSQFSSITYMISLSAIWACDGTLYTQKRLGENNLLKAG